VEEGWGCPCTSQLLEQRTISLVETPLAKEFVSPRGREAGARMILLLFFFHISSQNPYLPELPYFADPVKASFPA